MALAVTAVAPPSCALTADIRRRLLLLRGEGHLLLLLFRGEEGDLLLFLLRGVGGLLLL